MTDTVSIRVRRKSLITQRRSRATERVFDHRQGLALAPHAADAQTGCTPATARKGTDAQEGTEAMAYTQFPRLMPYNLTIHSPTFPVAIL